jgi:diguanylate cyclase
MDLHEQSFDTRPLHRRVLQIYWIVFILSLLAEGVAFIIHLLFYPEKMNGFLIRAVAVPTVIQLVAIGLIELIWRKGLERTWSTLAGGTVIAAALVIGNPSIHIQFIFLLSMVVSLFYFDVKQLYLALALNLSAFAVIYALHPMVRQTLSIFEISAFSFLMVGMMVIIRSVIYRGMEILEDHTRMAKSEQELLVKHALMDRMVKIDALTDLYNHKTFHQYLDMLIEQSNNTSLPLQLAVLDIDNFKCINDTFGHSIGDTILTRVARVLSETFSQNEIAARYGGEEFAVIFPGASLSEAFDKLEEARQRIESLIHSELDGRRVTVSIGLSSHGKGQSGSQLFSKADSLLYSAKRSGKNKTVM